MAEHRRSGGRLGPGVAAAVLAGALIGCGATDDTGSMPETSGAPSVGAPMVMPANPSPSATPTQTSEPTVPGSNEGTCPSGDACAVDPPEMPTGVAGSPAPMPGSTPRPDGSLDPSQPTCFEFHNHGQPVSGDTSKYSVILGEHYVCNHYTVPWNEPAEMVSWQSLYDNRQVLHHWLLYSVPGGAVDGQFEPCIGTHVLQDAQLVAGWAVGGDDVDMPENVGLRMPGAERSFLLEWHFYNSTGVLQQDGSGISICVLPAGTREHTAGMTWLGTENFNGPAGMPPGTTEFASNCLNDSGAPIHIFRFWPHMHQWGRNMASSVIRAGSTAPQQVFSKPFDFNFQVSYEADVTLMPGDSIRSTCTFNNQSLGPVAFGPSSNQEMCYQFAFSYPAGALDNGVLSLVGATNTCW